MKVIVARLALVCVLVSLALTFPCPVGAVKGADLVLYLPFDEGQGDVTEDLSGNANTGELMGDPTWIPNGKYEGAISFDGTDDHVVVPDSGFSTLGEKGDSYTVEFWIKTTQQSDNPDWWQCPAIMAKRGLASKFRVFTMYLTPDGAVGLHFEEPQEELVSESAVNDDEWRHIGATRSGGEAHLYVDGKLESESSITDNDKSAPEESVIIGARMLDTGQISRYLQGSLDEVAIYYRALTEAQIKQDMLNTVLSVSPAGSLATTWAAVRVQD